MEDEKDNAEQFNRIFNQCSPFYRDATFSQSIIDKHKVGLLLRERWLVDSTHKFGGLLGNHRYLIVSGVARDISAFAQVPEWGLCLSPSKAIFKVIGQQTSGKLTQTILLEIPEKFAIQFCTEDLSEMELTFAGYAEESFKNAAELSPLRELNNPEFLGRMEWPLGMREDGAYFPLFESDNPMSDYEIKCAAHVLVHQSAIHLAHGDVPESNSSYLQSQEMLARLNAH
jgi:hypothetical protein